MSEGSLPVSAELRIDAMCQAFEAAWKAAGEADPRPRIEEYLGTTIQPERDALFGRSGSRRRRPGPRPTRPGGSWKRDGRRESGAVRSACSGGWRASASLPGGAG